MRKTIAAVSAAGALLFGGAAVANATVDTAPAPSTTTTLAQDNGNQQHSDKTGLWGLLGLLGLGGLAGLTRRKDTDAAGAPGTTRNRSVQP